MGDRALDGGDLNENAPNVVRLGGELYRVVPQPIARLTNRLPEVFEAIQSEGGELDTSNLADFFIGGGHRVLQLFIPNLMPVEQFQGDADQPETWADTPTFPEIKRAFEVAMAVNEFDLVKHLGKLMGPRLKALVQAQIAEFFLQNSLTSPSTSGESESTPSTPNGAVPGTAVESTDESSAEPANGASRSLAATPS
jgi:hypothetical protein